MIKLYDKIRGAFNIGILTGYCTLTQMPSDVTATRHRFYAVFASKFVTHSYRLWTLDNKNVYFEATNNCFDAKYL